MSKIIHSFAAVEYGGILAIRKCSTKDELKGITHDIQCRGNRFLAMRFDHGAGVWMHFEREAVEQSTQTESKTSRDAYDVMREMFGKHF